MKSNSNDSGLRNGKDLLTLRMEIDKEKDALITMFLASASHSALTEHYKLIDQLNKKIQKRSRR